MTPLGPATPPGSHPPLSSSPATLRKASRTKRSRPTVTSNNADGGTGSTSNRNRVLQYTVLVALSALLGHTLSLLHKGHVLVEQQRDAFALQHKNDFVLQGRGPKEVRQTARDDSVSQSTINTAAAATSSETTTTTTTTTTTAIWKDLTILVAIASYDFSQIPHLEETLDGYHELCVAGAARVDVQVHTTVMYPVALLDMYRTRFPCSNFHLTFVIVNKRVRLHLADQHRTLFYQEINNYDLFVYTEDDIRVTPTTVATYLEETRTIQQLTPHNYTLYNVGVVRYEYNFPSGVVINDKTRHATENVTRVYWEHSHNRAAGTMGKIPNHRRDDIIPDAQAVLAVNSLNHLLLLAEGNDNNNSNQNQNQPQQRHHYVHMRNHHQGMFMATREHLLRWKELPDCQFDKIQRRPGLPQNPKQPLMGTQRVWMSSYQLYEPNPGCNIQQVLPVEHFGALTVHHIPNKNYRRKQGPNGKTVLQTTNHSLSELSQGDPKLIKALQLHLAMRQTWPAEPHRPKYHGCIQVIDKVTHGRSPVLDRRLQAFQRYVQRGGVLSEEDLLDTDLVPWEERMAQ